MKLSAFVVGAVLSGQIVIPQKADVRLHYLDTGYRSTSLCKAGQIEVTGPRFIENNRNEENLPADESEMDANSAISKKQNVFCFSAAQFANEQRWSKSVYSTRVNTGEAYSRGTSFLVSNNIVMTNKHIVQPTAFPEVGCKEMEIRTREAIPRWIGCKKIILCNATQDYCFIEMKEVEPGINLGDLSRPLPLNDANIVDQKAYAISNSAGLGIQSAKGPIVTDTKNVPRDMRNPGIILHYIPTLAGASGSPILNSSGEVIAIHHSHGSYGKSTQNYMDPDGDSFNMATSMSFISSDVRRRGYLPALEALFR